MVMMRFGMVMMGFSDAYTRLNNSRTGGARNYVAYTTRNELVRIYAVDTVLVSNIGGTSNRTDGNGKRSVP